MARYTGADCKRCRREKMKLFLKGSKCESPKCPIEIRPYPPGEHGRGRQKDSEYLLQLREKQKARRIYGVLEKQFRGYYEEANRRTGKTGDNLLQLLERRLDNVVYRAGFAHSRDMARQLVKHGHFLVNGRKVDIPSYLVDESDIVEVRESSRELTPFLIARFFYRRVPSTTRMTECHSHARLPPQQNRKSNPTTWPTMSSPHCGRQVTRRSTSLMSACMTKRSVFAVGSRATTFGKRLNSRCRESPASPESTATSRSNPDPREAGLRWRRSFIPE
jgi:small subunit ribosomal protein S4